jgi:predicted transcriptional regulator
LCVKYLNEELLFLAGEPKKPNERAIKRADCFTLRMLARELSYEAAQHVRVMLETVSKIVSLSMLFCL